MDQYSRVMTMTKTPRSPTIRHVEPVNNDSLQGGKFFKQRLQHGGYGKGKKKTPNLEHIHIQETSPLLGRPEFPHSKNKANL